MQPARTLTCAALVGAFGVLPVLVAQAAPVTLGSPSVQAARDVRTAPQDPWLQITIVVSAEGAGSPQFRFDDAARAPDTLTALARAEAAGRGVTSAGVGDTAAADTARLPPVEPLEGGGVIVRFGPRPLDAVAPLLSHLPPDRSEVRVLVRISPDLRGGDMWEFQAQLSAARIRQVRIESDTPPGPLTPAEGSDPLDRSIQHDTLRPPAPFPEPMEIQ